jgi:molybdenum cofactor cytidylyltransferase
MISAIVVAAGESSRMGSVDKLSLPFRSSTILETVLQELENSAVDEIVVVLKDIKTQSGFSQFPKVRYAENPNPEDGLTSSIQAGIRVTDISVKHYLICLADMPLISSKDYNCLTNKTLNNNDKVIYRPSNKSTGGNPVLFSQHFREDILALKDPHGCKSILLNNSEYVQTIFTTEPGFYTDIDTQEDYESILNSIS